MEKGKISHHLPGVQGSKKFAHLVNHCGHRIWEIILHLAKERKSLLHTTRIRRETSGNLSVYNGYSVRLHAKKGAKKEDVTKYLLEETRKKMLNYTPIVIVVGVNDVKHFMDSQKVKNHCNNPDYHREIFCKFWIKKVTDSVPGVVPLDSANRYSSSPLAVSWGNVCVHQYSEKVNPWT